MKATALPIAALVAFLVAGPARAADPFYESLLRNGTHAYDRGAFAEAARELRLACFGLLEEPLPLAECLVRLGVAQASSGDPRGFEETFRRLLEVEERFGGYSKASIPAAVRAAFEERAAAAIPAATLESAPAFAGMVLRRAEAQIAAVPAKQRKKELEGRLAKEPRSFAWNLLLGELVLTEGGTAASVAQALPLAEQAAALAPDNPRAFCLRGHARARAGRCADAIADLESCPDKTRRADLAAALQGCQGANGAAAPARPAAQPVAPTAEAPAAPAADRIVALGTDDARIAHARQILETVASPKDLRRAYQLAREAANERPEDRNAQLIAAEAAYRNARWQDAVTYFRRAGDPGDGRPELLFYLAVACYESGDRATAATVLRRSLPNLKRSEFVDSYTKKILGAAGR